MNQLRNQLRRGRKEYDVLPSCNHPNHFEYDHMFGYFCPDFEPRYKPKKKVSSRKERHFFKHLKILKVFKKIIEKKLGIDAKIIRGPKNFHYLVFRIPKGKKLKLMGLYAKAKKELLFVMYVKNWEKTWRAISTSDCQEQLDTSTITKALVRNGIFGIPHVVLACQRPPLPKLRKFLTRNRIEYMNYQYEGLSATIVAFLMMMIWKKAGRIKICPKCGQARLFLKFRKRPTCPSCGARVYMRRWLDFPLMSFPPPEIDTS